MSSNCTCKLGGKICGVCRGRAAQLDRAEDTRKRVKVLEEIVRSLEARLQRLESIEEGLEE